MFFKFKTLSCLVSRILPISVHKILTPSVGLEAFRLEQMRILPEVVHWSLPPQSYAWTLTLTLGPQTSSIRALRSCGRLLCA